MVLSPGGCIVIVEVPEAFVLPSHLNSFFLLKRLRPAKDRQNLRVAGLVARLLAKLHLVN
jgi:hypothetical protein